MITLSAEEKQIYTIQQGIQEIQIRNRIHTNYLKNNPNTECDSSNFKLLLWVGSNLRHCPSFYVNDKPEPDIGKSIWILFSRYVLCKTV